MNHDVHRLARTTLRNAAAMSFVGLLAKAMGLVVGILVARFLGPSGLGLFALLLSLSIIAEQVGAFGVPDVVLRAVGAKPASVYQLWSMGRRLVLKVCFVPTAAFVCAAALYRHDASLSTSLLLTAACVPLTALGNVGQSALQAIEQVAFVTWVNLATRAISLVLLAGLLAGGVGVEGAFIARVVFQGGILLAYSSRLRRHRTAGPAVESGLATAAPFAGARAVTELALRTPTFIVSSSLGLTATGLYDAADRVSQIMQVVINSGLSALLPLFSRSVSSADEARHAYVRYALKYTVLLVGLVGAVASAVGAEVISLLYGRAYVSSAAIVTPLLGAQVLIAGDVVVRQSLFAHRRERAALLVSCVYIIGLALLATATALTLGLPGVAWSVVAAAAIALALDIALARRSGVDLDLGNCLVRPLLACAPAFIISDVAAAWAWPLRMIVVVATFAASCAVLSMFRREERRMIGVTFAPLLRTVRGARIGRQRD